MSKTKERIRESGLRYRQSLGQNVIYDDGLLAELTETYDVAGWDGFDGTAEGVLDGEGFLLTITWENGFSIHASGENAFPARYGDFRDAVRELFGE